MGHTMEKTADTFPRKRSIGRLTPLDVTLLAIIIVVGALNGAAAIVFFMTDSVFNCVMAVLTTVLMCVAVCHLWRHIYWRNETFAMMVKLRRDHPYMTFPPGWPR